MEIIKQTARSGSHQLRLPLTPHVGNPRPPAALRSPTAKNYIPKSHHVQFFTSRMVLTPERVEETLEGGRGPPRAVTPLEEERGMVLTKMPACMYVCMYVCPRPARLFLVKQKTAKLTKRLI